MAEHALLQVVQQAIIANDKGHVLIIRRPEGVWQFAGGRIEVGERWEDALRREVREETGIDDLEIVSILMVDNFTWLDVPLYSVYFHCRSHRAEIVLSQEHDRYRWLTRDDDLDQVNFWHPKLRMLAARVLQSL